MNGIEAIAIEVAHSTGAQHIMVEGVCVIDSPDVVGDQVRLELRGADGSSSNTAGTARCCVRRCWRA